MANTRTFHEIFSTVLEENLKLTQETHSLTTLNVYACTKIYQTIFSTVVGVLQQSQLGLSNESANYIAQQYYDGTLINGRYELDPNIFDKRAKLENIPTDELVKITALLRGTDFVKPVIEEIKKRN